MEPAFGYPLIELNCTSVSSLRSTPLPTLMVSSSLSKSHDNQNFRTDWKYWNWNLEVEHLNLPKLKFCIVYSKVSRIAMATFRATCAVRARSAHEKRNNFGTITN